MLPGARLVLAGDRPHRASLAERAQRLGIAGRTASSATGHTPSYRSASPSPTCS
ncbi:MAG: hypothetical protein U0Z44_05375 [Kouleothrix sp.]